jgi:uncharacterized membrane protein
MHAMKFPLKSLRFVLVATALTLAGAACDSGGGSPTVDCTKLGHEVPKFSEITVLKDTCSDCHGTTVTGNDRMDAPKDINFDDYASAKLHANEAANEVYNGNMPPTGTSVSSTEAQALYEWALCGTPQ